MSDVDTPMQFSSLAERLEFKKRERQRWIWNFIDIAAPPALLALVAAVCCAFWFAYQRWAGEVATTMPIGSIVSAQFISESWSSLARTQVNTDRGTFLVDGTFHALTGTPLTLETRKNDRRFLCGGEPRICKKMVD